MDMSKPQIEFYVVEAKASFVQSQQQQLNPGVPAPGTSNNHHMQSMHPVPMQIPPPPNLNPGG